MSAIGLDSFAQAYQDIGMLLCIPGIDDDKANVNRLFKPRLSDERFGNRLMITENADDMKVLFNRLEQDSGSERLIDNLTHSRKCSIVFITRTREAAIKLAENIAITLCELNELEAKRF